MILFLSSLITYVGPAPDPTGFLLAAGLAACSWPSFAAYRQARLSRPSTFVALAYATALFAWFWNEAIEKRRAGLRERGLSMTLAMSSLTLSAFLVWNLTSFVPRFSGVRDSAAARRAAAKSPAAKASAAKARPAASPARPSPTRASARAAAAAKRD